MADSSPPVQRSTFGSLISGAPRGLSNMCAVNEKKPQIMSTHPLKRMRKKSENYDENICYSWKV